MSILSILEYGVFHVIEFAKWRTESRPSVEEPREQIPHDRLPDSHALSGVPMRILLSDRSGPGGLLRDTLLIRPSSRDH